MGDSLLDNHMKNVEVAQLTKMPRTQLQMGGQERIIKKNARTLFWFWTDQQTERLTQQVLLSRAHH